MRSRVFLVTLCALASCPVASWAQYPAKSILVISPVQAGSAGDTTLRLVTHKISENLQQQLVVENMPGAAGMIGTERLARATPDGYTIGGISDSTLTYVPILQKRTGFDPLAMLDPVSLISRSTWVLVTHPSLPVKSVRQLIALAKRNPGALDYASAGNGGSHHLVMEMFKKTTGVSVTHVPFRGATQAALDVQSGRIPMMFSALSPVLPAIRSARLNPLAVATASRSPLLPDVPTLNEAGVPDFTFSTWTGMFVPKGTPRAIVDRLSAEVAKAVTDPTVRERLQANGGNPQPTTPEALAEITRELFTRMARIIKEADIKVE